MEIQKSKLCGSKDDEEKRQSDDTFLVEKSKFTKIYLNDLLKSNSPKDKTMLNLIVTKIVKNDHKDSFEYLLNNGYKIDVLNNQNQTAIHLIVYHNADQILEWGNDFLLSNCAKNVNTTDINGLSYLHFACMIGKKKAVKKYLENSSDVNARWYHDSQDDRDGFSPLHFAVMYHKTEIVKFLLYRGADVNLIDSLGRTPLHIACCISKKFSKSLEDDLTKHPEWNAEMKVMKLLLAQGANLNSVDKLGNTPLLSIFQNDRYRREIKSLDETFDDKENTKNKISLFKRQKEKLDYLMEHGIDITTVNNNGENILHRIIGDLKPLRFPIIYEKISFDDEFHAKLIDQLLALKCGIDINKKTASGETPLIHALSFISYDIVKVLLDHEADMTNLKFNNQDENFFNYPAIHPNFNAMRNIFDIIDLLEDNGFQMSLRDNLKVLKFLMHKIEKCECCDISNPYICSSNMYHTFCYADPKHIDYVLKNLESLCVGADFEEPFKSVTIHNLFQYLKLCKTAKMYYHKGWYNMVKESNCCSLEKFFEVAKKELARMKRITLEKDVTLYDLLVMDMQNIDVYVEDLEKINKLLQHFICYKDILEGRITRSVSISYFLNSAADYLRKLINSLLTDDCCDMIIECLDLDDLFNVCLAAVDDDLDDKVDLKSLHL